MKQLFYNKIKRFFEKDNIRSFGLSLVLLLIASFVQWQANRYIITVKGTAVPDFFLDHLPSLNIEGFIIFCSILFTFLIAFLLLWKQQYINFALKSLSVFIIVRAFLISLTHLGPNVDQLMFDGSSPGFWIYNLLYNTNNDFFFSGHTGIPFLFALIFWPNKFWRYTFIVFSIVGGSSMLFAHIHYSIDVFAAPFITYSIYAFCSYYFLYDYRISRS